MAQNTLDDIRNIVNLKFTNSPYILRRVLPDGVPSGTPKFRPEEVEYWTQLIFNSGWDMSTGSTIFDTEFDKTYSVDHSKSSVSIAENNYIGQTFKIEKKKFPNGTYITSIIVFTAIEDLSATISLDVRPLVNGIPSDPLPMSQVTLTPVPEKLIPSSERKIWDPTILTPEEQKSARKFEFEYPIFLSSGGPGADSAYYCFTLTTNSKSYEVYVCESGKPTLVSGNIVSNPYLGDFIYSSQGQSWVIDPTKDLCFSINRANFSIGTEAITFNYPKPTVDFPFDELNVNCSFTEINEKAFIGNSTASVNKIDTDLFTTIPVPLNSNVILPYTSSLNNDNGLTFTVQLTNTDSTITPTVDTKATGVTLTKNYIDAYSSELSDAELAKPSKDGIQAFAKYMTRPVVLNEGFDADGITVYVDVKKPVGTEIEVFYRILNRYDASVAFSNSRWYRLTKKTTEVPALLSEEYSQETYEDLNIVYYGDGDGAVYNTFNQLAVKVVFYSDNSTVVPTIKNLRVIATI